jgi:hypothetical protein
MALTENFVSAAERRDGTVGRLWRNEPGVVMTHLHVIPSFK